MKYASSTFYEVTNGKIAKIWMIFDLVHLLYEASCDALPFNWNPLRHGWVRSPSGMDGLPAPVSFAINPDDSAKAKVIAWQALHHDLLVGPVAFTLWRDDMKWYGSYGFGLSNDFVEYSYFLTRALSLAFTQRFLQIDMFVCEGQYCAAHGNLVGNFSGKFLGENPSYKMTSLRFALHWHTDVEHNEIIEGYGLFDIPGFFTQSGIDLFKRC